MMSATVTLPEMAVSAMIAALAVIEAMFIGALSVNWSRRRRAELALRASEVRHRALLKVLPDLMFVLSRDGDYLDYHARNPEDLFVPPEIFMGKNMRDIMPPELDALFRERFEEALTTGEPAVLEYSLPMGESEKHFEVRIVQRDDGNFASIVRDITEQRAADEALAETRAQLARVSRAMTLGALTSSIAHEVSQPLAAVLVNAHACRRYLSADSVDLDEVSDCLVDLERDAARASAIISRVRTLITRTPAQRSPLDLNDAIGDVIELVRDDITSDGVVLTMELERDLPKVEGDRVQLQQVLLNLIRNGVEAMRDVGDLPKRLVIQSRRSTPSVIEVEVSDSGVGLEPGAEDRIFDAFYTTKTDGTGLGLAMSRGIIEAHGGRLWAATNADGGATFRFTLASAPLPSALSAPSLPQPAASGAATT